jgi:hypothetical protein
MKLPTLTAELATIGPRATLLRSGEQILAECTSRDHAEIGAELMRRANAYDDLAALQAVVAAYLSLGGRIEDYAALVAAFDKLEKK